MSSHFANKKVLITGGIGFIGSNLAIELVNQGAEVTLVDSMIPLYGAKLFNVEPIKDQVHINFSDIRDSHSLGFLVQNKDYIFSLAGQLSHIDSMTDPFTDLEINCSSQLSLLECCRHNKVNPKIVFASTRQLYGKPQYLPVDEKHPLQPVDVNGINNLAAEQYYTLYHQVYGMRTVSLRLTNTYGPRMDVNSTSKGFLGVFMRLVLDGKDLKLFGDGQQRRDFNYVDDVVSALLIAAEQDSIDGGVFNLSHPVPYSLQTVVEYLQEIAPINYEIVPFPEDRKKIDIGDYFGSSALFEEKTGWKPTIDLREGLQKTYEFFHLNRSEYLV
ncbi:MAG: NAD-dependent epimerase/dehydratase family protein [Bdellovibrionales bacterium]|nr:NAD-dependent epimerase/dehydratase family protein [Bdellovibrionales bacterium]